MAKLIIKLINCVARTINQDPLVSQVLKVVFLPDFNVKSGHRIIPPRICRNRSPRQARKRRAQAT